MTTYEMNIDTANTSLTYFQAEKYIYGSSRLGMLKDSVNVLGSAYTNTDTSNFVHTLGNKRYELSNHLGNVLTVISDKPIPHNNGGTVDYFMADIKSAQDYSPFGVTLSGRDFNSFESRYGFNSMEKDDEVKGRGNSYDFGARMYDSRLGRWLSIDAKAKPFVNPYNFCINNPIIFVDPDGNTEFYFGGIWIGTDGNNNGLIGKVQDKKVAKNIKSHTKKGLNYSSQSTDKAATVSNSILLIQAEVLAASYELLELSITKEGEKGEYTQGMKKNSENGCFEIMGQIRYYKGDHGFIPKGSEVGLHSHATGVDKDGKRAFANVPSMFNDPGLTDEERQGTDQCSFELLETNIIVGNTGIIEDHYDTETKRKWKVDNRNPSIVIYNSGTVNLGAITKEEAKTMIEGNRGEAGAKFDKKQAKKANKKPPTQPKF